ncbi:hypothetical protein Purlil1_7940 [Purpureocillium lilacinum]|uniref:Uncharacterized protein n=1 Tax=Purpureocillium lilacinum TaxID=33203 RepID=A0ABR0BU68_PURLI|nr:hypothetical protein Purlil1_7940 [Purpureocillium lilacinum]
MCIRLTSVLCRRIKNVSEPCPPDYSKRGEGTTDYTQSVYWSLQEDKSNSFYADLLSSTGIPKTKMKFGDYYWYQSCSPGAEPEDSCHAFGIDYGTPIPDGFGAGDVADPQKVAAKALDNSQSLVEQVSSVLLQLKLRCFGGDSFELVDSISLPILMIVQAVESMSQVETVAGEIEEAKRKTIILAFLGAILLFVPIAGQVLGALTELADLAIILTILGAVGNAALDVYTIVDDPDNAPLAIFSLVLEPLALADLAKISKAAGIRRGMTDADVLKLGGTVSKRMGMIKKVTGTCSRK